VISLTFNVSDHIAQLIGDQLIELNALSVSFNDSDLNTENEIAIFGENPDDHERYWKNTKVISLFNPETNIELLIKKLHKKFNIYQHQIEVEKLKNIDWVKETQSQFKPIQINEKIWIIPSWHKIQNQSVINIHLDPGLAFGTGSHPTTKLCLDWLSEIELTNKSILDYGCGSGILAIAAKKLGSAYTIGVDIDPQAIIASNQNAEKNNVNEINFLQSNNSIDEKFDVVLANILSSTLKVLAPIISSKCNDNGKIALSGILKTQEKEIREIYANDFIFNESLYQDGWVCITANKKS
jgi:ribosomal protein L11 methyltransferase